MINHKKALLVVSIFFSDAFCYVEKTPKPSPFTSNSIEKALCFTYSKVISERFCNIGINITNEIRKSHGLTDLSGQEPILLQLKDALYTSTHLLIDMAFKGNINSQAEISIENLSLIATKFYNLHLADISSDKQATQETITAYLLKHSQSFFVYLNEIMITLEETFTDSVLAKINAKRTDPIKKDNPLVIAFMDELKSLFEIDKRNKKLQKTFSKFWQDQAGQFIPHAYNPFNLEDRLSIKLVCSTSSDEIANYCKTQMLEFINILRAEKQKAPLSGKESVIIECSESLSHVLCALMKMLLKEQFKLNVILEIIGLRNTVQQCVDFALVGLAPKTEIIDEFELYLQTKQLDHLTNFQQMVSSCITAIENKVIKSVDISRENAGLEPLKSEEKHNLDLSHELQTMFEMKAFNAKLQKMCSDLWKEVA